jgi:hypothetical protein
VKNPRQQVTTPPPLRVDIYKGTLTAISEFHSQVILSSPLLSFVSVKVCYATLFLLLLHFLPFLVTFVLKLISVFYLLIYYSIELWYESYSNGLNKSCLKWDFLFI